MDKNLKKTIFDFIYLGWLVISLKHQVSELIIEFFLYVLNRIWLLFMERKWLTNIMC